MALAPGVLEGAEGHARGQVPAGHTTPLGAGSTGGETAHSPLGTPEASRGAPAEGAGAGANGGQARGGGREDGADPVSGTTLGTGEYQQHHQQHQQELCHPEPQRLEGHPQRLGGDTVRTGASSARDPGHLGEAEEGVGGVLCWRDVPLQPAVVPTPSHPPPPIDEGLGCSPLAAPTGQLTLV